MSSVRGWLGAIGSPRHFACSMNGTALRLDRRICRISLEEAYAPAMITASSNNPPGQQAAAPYPIEMPFAFEGGSGTTRTISREEVCFLTDVILAAGQRLTGTLCFPEEDGGAGCTLVRYTARVLHVERSAEAGGAWKATAAFEEIEFLPPEPVGTV